MKEVKQLKVSAINNGTVIDHIPAKSLFNVIVQLLKLIGRVVLIQMLDCISCRKIIPFYLI